MLIRISPCHVPPVKVKFIQPLPTNPDGSVAVELPQAAAAAELRELSDSLADTQVGWERVSVDRTASCACHWL